MQNNFKKQYNKIMLDNKKIYLIANPDDFNNQNNFLNAIASAIKGGIDIILLKWELISTSEIIEIGKKIKLLCAEFNITFIINERADIAFILEADGLHLNQDSIDIKSAKTILGDNSIIGILVNTPDQAIKAQNEGADFLSVPIFEKSKKQNNNNNNLEFLNWISKNIKIPYFAVSGINLNNIDLIIQNGANKIGIEKEITNTENPEHATIKFLQNLS